MQNKLPLINSEHGSETRNIINELIKLFNGMGYTYDEALQNARNILSEAQKTNDMNKDVQQQIDTLIAESGTSDAEVIQARGDAPLLKDRLDKTDSQLSQTVTGIEHNLLPKANGINRLEFDNYLGNDQNMHPKVVGFDVPWNGYKYWMGYTPYPYSNATEENPCIAVSNDKVNWETPPGLTNPLDEFPGGRDGMGTNSDTHLVYREDINTLELWWRTYDVPYSGGFEQIIYRRTTKDGITWTPKEVMIATGGDDLISPAVIFEDGIYKMWSITKWASNPEHKIRYIESLDSSGKTWTEPVVLEDIDYSVVEPWHIDVISTELGYEMVVSERGNSGASRDFFYILQNPEGTFTKPKVILEVNKNPDAFDSNFMYRASLFKEDGTYYLHYSFNGKDGRWGTSLSYGKSITLLRGYPIDLSHKKVVTLAGNEVLTDYDVSDVDVFMIPGQISGEGVVFNSFKNIKRGKPIFVILSTPSSKATFKFSTHIFTPNNKDLTVDNTQRIAMMYPTADSQGVLRYTVAVFGESKVEKNPVMLAGNEVLTDYDVSGVSAFIIPHSVAGVGVTFNSFVNAELGQTIPVVCRNSSSIATFKYSAERLITHSQVDYELSYSGVVGATLVCTNISGVTRFNVI